jgi:hypothetical protein
MSIQLNHFCCCWYHRKLLLQQQEAACRTAAAAAAVCCKPCHTLSTIFNLIVSLSFGPKYIGSRSMFWLMVT